MRRLYLDNAATSFPKAPGVAQAVARHILRIGAAPGRASYAESRESGRILEACRERICRLINGASADHVIFTLNGTDALNMAIKGVAAHARRVREGRPVHMVASVLDHNSVLRPLNAIAAVGVEWTCVPCNEEGIVDPALVGGALRPDTALVTIAHASNVTGAIQPVGEIAALCRRRGVLLLVDAAQSVGHIPVDAGAIGPDLLAFPGHKGLLGPLGTGVLYVRPGVESKVDPLRVGGTGTASELDVQPEFLPDKYEAGSANAPGLAGLAEAVAWILEHSAGFAHERDLTALMLEGLGSGGARLSATDSRYGANGPLAGFRVLGPADAARRVGVFTLAHDGINPHDLAAVLEAEFGILARAGLHCAPRVHGVMGTSESGGLRLSLGPFVTADDVRYACESLGDAAAGLLPRGVRASRRS